MCSSDIAWNESAGLSSSQIVGPDKFRCPAALRERHGSAASHQDERLSSREKHWDTPT